MTFSDAGFLGILRVNQMQHSSSTLFCLSSSNFSSKMNLLIFFKYKIKSEVCEFFLVNKFEQICPNFHQKGNFKSKEGWVS